MPSYMEHDLERAVEEVKAGRLSLNTIAKKYGIPLSTLFQQVNGAQPKVTSAIEQQALTPAQEAALAYWVLEQASRGNAPSREEVRLRHGYSGGCGKGPGRYIVYEDLV